MSDFISKKEADRFMNIDCEVKGIGIRDDFLYVEKVRGKEVVEKIEKAIQDLGYDFELESINPLGYYPVGFEALGLIGAHKIAGLSVDEIREMGVYEPKDSLIIRLFMKYFISIDMIAKKAPDMWRSYYTKGTLSVPKMDKEERESVVVIKNFKIHPLHCRMLEGYLATLLKTVVRSEVKCREMKCPFEGDDFHKFVLNY